MGAVASSFAPALESAEPSLEIFSFLMQHCWQLKPVWILNATLL